MSAKPVWGWQPRRSLGSCGSETEWKTAGDVIVEATDESGKGQKGEERDKGEKLQGRWRREVDYGEDRGRRRVMNRWGSVDMEGVGGEMQDGERWQVKSNWGHNNVILEGQHCSRLIEPCLNPPYLVEESLEDAGSFDWQRTGDSNLFFQYNCRRWEGGGGGHKRSRGSDRQSPEGHMTENRADTSAIMSSTLLGIPVLKIQEHAATFQWTAVAFYKDGMNMMSVRRWYLQTNKMDSHISQEQVTYCLVMSVYKGVKWSAAMAFSYSPEMFLPWKR